MIIDALQMPLFPVLGEVALRADFFATRRLVALLRDAIFIFFFFFAFDFFAFLDFFAMMTSPGPLGSVKRLTLIASASPGRHRRAGWIGLVALHPHVTVRDVDQREPLRRAIGG